MGIDGCGKSSLALALQKEFERNGQKTVVTWATLQPVLIKPFIIIAKYMMVRKHDKFDDYKTHITAKKKGMNKFAFAHGIYFLVMFIDYLPQVFYKVVLPRMFGRTIICDRYFHDLMLDYTITTNAKPNKMLELINFSARFFPKPDLHYFVTVPPEVSFSRKNDIPSLEYLKERNSFYEAMANDLNLPILNGTLPWEENCLRIINDFEKLKG
ncbi:MAG: deoxynucleoside kinase [Candidatus Heimdallarchaeota archaeon]|nr:deoxynucleoside kinase [Candidatus Heimdallarchaeota archaeon]